MAPAAKHHVRKKKICTDVVVKETVTRPAPHLTPYSAEDGTKGCNNLGHTRISLFATSVGFFGQKTAILPLALQSCTSHLWGGQSGCRASTRVRVMREARWQMHRQPCTGIIFPGLERRAPLWQSTLSDTRSEPTKNRRGAAAWAQSCGRVYAIYGEKQIQETHQFHFTIFCDENVK